MTPSSTSFPRECGRTGHGGRPDLFSLIVASLLVL